MIKFFRFLFTLSLLLVSLGTLAQPEPEDRKLAIRGQLLDAEFKEPMVQATIQLFTASDTIFVGGTVTNERGNFYVVAPRSGTYRLKEYI